MRVPSYRPKEAFPWNRCSPNIPECFQDIKREFGRNLEKEGIGKEPAHIGIYGTEIKTYNKTEIDILLSETDYCLIMVRYLQMSYQLFIPSSVDHMESTSKQQLLHLENRFIWLSFSHKE